MNQGIIRLVSFKSDSNKGLMQQISQLVIREAYIHFIANMVREMSFNGYNTNIPIEKLSKNFAIAIDNIILDTAYFYSSNKLVYDFIGILEKGHLTEHLHYKTEYIFQILDIDSSIYQVVDQVIIDDVVHTVRKYIKRAINNMADLNIDDFCTNVLGVYSDFYTQDIGLKCISYHFSMISWDKPLLIGVFPT